MNGISYDISELSNYQVRSFECSESINGAIPRGKLSLFQDKDDIDLDIEELTINFIAYEETEFNLKASVIKATYYYGYIEYDLAFVPKDFYSTTKVKEYSGVNPLIKVYPGDIVGDYSNDSGLDSVKIFQNNLTDHKMLEKYLMMLKKDKLFAIRWDCLYFTDIYKDPFTTMDIAFTSKDLSLNISKSKYLDLEPESQDLPTNGISLVSYGNEFKMVATEFAKAQVNAYYNKNRWSENTDQVEYDFPYPTGLRAGDLVKATSREYEKNLYIVKSFKITCDGNKTMKEKIVLGAI